jgi:hypothetical protein
MAFVGGDDRAVRFVWVAPIPLLEVPWKRWNEILHACISL